MAQLLHHSARTTPTTRREIQLCKENLKLAAQRFNVNPKTITRWRKRNHVNDLPMGPKPGYSKVLSEAEEQVIIKFRNATKLPLDDVLYALREKAIPHVTRTTLYRCLKRHGCGRLAQKATPEEKKPFKKYPIGYFHVDIATVRTAEGKQYLFVAVDSTSKLCYAHVYKTQQKADAAAFLTDRIAHVPYKIHKVRTDSHPVYQPQAPNFSFSAYF